MKTEIFWLAAKRVLHILIVAGIFALYPVYCVRSWWRDAMYWIARARW